MERVLETKSGAIHYWISDHIDKQKMTIFFLHGLTANHNLFVKQIEYFQGKYNVIAWDAPAHGASRPYTHFTYGKAALAARDILDDNNIDKTVLVGQSLGGYISQSVIKRFPERVAAFVSIDSTPFGAMYYSKSDRWLLGQIEWMAKIYPANMLRKSVTKQCTISKRAYENMYNMLSTYDKDELCHLMGIEYAGFLEDNCDLDITCPVLLIVGKKDKTGKVQQYNRAWAKQLGVQVTWIEDAAHNSNDDQPELVNQAIDEFLNRPSYLTI